jgi:hypothetical protein
MDGSHVTSAYSGCRWEEIPLHVDHFDVRRALRELYATRLVRYDFPCIAAIIHFFYINVTQSVLTAPNSARLIYLVRGIIDSLVTVGYVAIYLDRTTHQLDVVSPFVYLAVTPHEYKLITGHRPRYQGSVRRDLPDLIESHVAYFPDESEEERFFDSKFGSPIVFVGDWRPDHGVPTTPCHAAFNSYETRKNLVSATKVTASRNAQPATGWVMQQPIGGMAGALNSINSITGAIRPNDVLDAYGQQVSSIRERQRADIELSREELRAHTVSGDLVDEISAIIQPGGEGHMAWTPQPAISGLDIGNQFDMMVAEVAIGYQIPPDALLLRAALEKAAKTSMREAHKNYTCISSMLNHVQMIVDQCRKVAELTAGKTKKLLLPEGRLKPTMPLEMLTEVNDVLSSEGRVELYADTLRVGRAMIDPQHLKEKEGEMMIEAATAKVSFEAPPAKSAKPAEPVSKRQRTE